MNFESWAICTDDDKGWKIEPFHMTEKCGEINLKILKFSAGNIKDT